MAGQDAPCNTSWVRGGAAEETADRGAGHGSPYHGAYSIADQSAAATTGQAAFPVGTRGGSPTSAAVPPRADSQEKVTKACNRADVL